MSKSKLQQRFLGEELTGDMKTDLEKYRVPRGPGGNPIRMGDKVRSMKGDQPLGKLKVKYGADKVREYYKKNKAVGEEVQVDEGSYHRIDGKYDGKRISGKFLKLPDKVGKGVKRNTDERHPLGKANDAVTDAVGLTNTKRDGVRKHDGVKGFFQMQNSYEPEGLDNLKEKNYSESPKKDIEEAQTRYYKDDQKGKTKQSFSDFYKKAKLAKHKKQTDKTYIDTKRHGVKFSDAKGSGRIRGGKKYYD